MKFSLLILLYTTLSFSAFAMASDRDHAILMADVKVEMLSSGVVEVEEERTFQFDGRFRFFEQRFDRTGFTNFELLSIEDAHHSYRESDSEEPGTYRISVSRNSITVRLFFDAVDEQRSFRLRYRLEGALSSDGEWAELNRNFIGRDWDSPTERTRLEILLPDQVSVDSLYLNIMTRAEIARERLTESGLLLETGFLPAKVSLGARLVFPARLVAQAEESPVSLNPADILAQKQQEAEAQILREQLAEQRAPYIIGLGVFSLFFTFYMIFTYRRKVQPGVKPPLYFEKPPSDMPPAMVGWLFRNRWSSHDARLVSTFFDLARRGFFRLEQKPDKDGEKPANDKAVKLLLSRTDKRDFSGCKSWEVDFIEKVEELLDGGKSELDKIFMTSDGYSHVKGFTTWYNGFFTAIGKEAREMGWINDNVGAISVQLLVQFALIGIAALFLFTSSGVSVGAGVFLLIAGCLGVAFSLLLRTRTEEGEQVYQSWVAYRNALKDQKTRNTDDLKGQHIVYAMVFGLSNKQFKGLMNSMNLQQDDLAWMMMMPGFMFNQTSVSNVFTQQSTSFGSSGISGTGAIGGSTGGGGGGSVG